MTDEKPTGGGGGDIIGSFFDTMGDFYKNQIGSPFALLCLMVYIYDIRCYLFHEYTGKNK